MIGKNDESHLKCAVIQKAVVLTSDQVFPKASKSSSINHNGILIIYKYNNPSKDMAPDKIARALKNIEAQELDLTNKVYPLNVFNY